MLELNQFINENQATIKFLVGDFNTYIDYEYPIDFLRGTLQISEFIPTIPKEKYRRLTNVILYGHNRRREAS